MTYPSLEDSLRRTNRSNQQNHFVTRLNEASQPNGASSAFAVPRLRNIYLPTKHLHLISRHKKNKQTHNTGVVEMEGVEGSGVVPYKLRATLAGHGSDVS